MKMSELEKSLPPLLGNLANSYFHLKIDAKSKKSFSITPKTNLKSQSL